MESKDVKINGVYGMKIGRNTFGVRIVKANEDGGYAAVNVKTDKELTVKSPKRLLGPWQPEETTTSVEAKTKTKRDTGEADAMGAKRDAKPMSLLDAAAHLLSLGSGDPMRCQTIVDLAIATE